jgi:hypothetical protein
MLRWKWMLVCVSALVLTPVVHAQSNPSLSLDDEQKLLEGTDTPPQRMGPGERLGEGRMRRGDRLGGPGEGPPPPGPGMHGQPPAELTAEQEARLFTILQEVNPQLVEKIKTWREVNPERSGRMLARMYDRMQDLIHLKTMDQPMYELKVQDIKLDARSRVLAIEYRQNPTDDSRKELLDILTDQFEVRQKIREHELARLKEKISQLENQIEERANNRQKIINKQLQDVTQKPGKAKW